MSVEQLHEKLKQWRSPLTEESNASLWKEDIRDISITLENEKILPAMKRKQNSIKINSKKQKNYSLQSNDKATEFHNRDDYIATWKSLAIKLSM